MWHKIKPNSYQVYYFEENKKLYAAMVRENWIYKIAPNGETKENMTYRTNNWVYLRHDLVPNQLPDEQICQWLEMVWRTGAWEAYAKNA